MSVDTSTESIIEYVDNPAKSVHSFFRDRGVHGLYLSPTDRRHNTENIGKHHVLVAKLTDERIKNLQNDSPLKGLEPQWYEDEYREFIVNAPNLRNAIYNQLRQESEARELLEKVCLEHELTHKDQEIKYGITQTSETAYDELEKLEKEMFSKDDEMLDQRTNEILNQLCRVHVFQEAEAYVKSLGTLQEGGSFTPTVIAQHTIDILGILRKDEFSKSYYDYLYNLFFSTNYSQLSPHFHEHQILASFILTTIDPDVLEEISLSSISPTELKDKIMRGIIESIRDPHEFLRKLKRPDITDKLDHHLAEELQKLKKLIKPQKTT